MRNRNRWLYIAISIILCLAGCFPYHTDVYNSRKYDNVINIIQQYDKEIEQCYLIAFELMVKHEGTFVYWNASTITISDERRELLKIENNVEQLRIPFQKIKGLRGITVQNDQMSFGGWGGLNSSIGFIYCPSDTITIYEIAPVENENEITKTDGAYYWEQTNGDNTAFLKKIQENYYYYELWF